MFGGDYGMVKIGNLNICYIGDEDAEYEHLLMKDYQSDINQLADDILYVVDMICEMESEVATLPQIYERLPRHIEHTGRKYKCNKDIVNDIIAQLLFDNKLVKSFNGYKVVRL